MVARAQEKIGMGSPTDESERFWKKKKDSKKSYAGETMITIYSAFPFPSVILVGPRFFFA